MSNGQQWVRKVRSAAQVQACPPRRYCESAGRPSASPAPSLLALLHLPLRVCPHSQLPIPGLHDAPSPTEDRNVALSCLPLWCSPPRRHQSQQPCVPSIQSTLVFHGRHGDAVQYMAFASSASGASVQLPRHKRHSAGHMKGRTAPERRVWRPCTEDGRRTWLSPSGAWAMVAQDGHGLTLWKLPAASGPDQWSGEAQLPALECAGIGEAGSWQAVAAAIDGEHWGGRGQRAG